MKMLAFSLSFLAAVTVTSVAGLSNALRHADTNTAFDITATVVVNHERYGYFSVADNLDHVILARHDCNIASTFLPGDKIQTRGKVSRTEKNRVVALCTDVRFLSHDSPPIPILASLQNINDGNHDAMLVRATGIITDAFREEQAPHEWVYLVLSDDNDAIYAAVRSKPAENMDIQSLIGTQVQIVGFVHPDEGGARHHYGRMIIIGNESDIKVIRRPIWWTPGKVLWTIGGLLAMLVATFAWSCSLRIIAERRSRELLREKIARVSAELRTSERTRLASDLHDTIAQNLTGVSLQLSTALRLASTDPAKMLLQLKRALLSIRSCREELRDCLWDLRAHALDMPDINEAIRLTLKPQLGSVKLNLRFNVPRHKLLDDTVHTTLQIVRELVSNAIVHGHAREIRIAGAIDGRKLMFSVHDDGCGFDPDHAPGAIDGHFGLQGIRERVQKHHGTVKIVSSPSQGTKTIITLS